MYMPYLESHPWSDGGFGGGAVALQHGRWTRPRTIDASALTGVSCVAATFCAATDAANHVLTFDGARWSAPSVEGIPVVTRGVRGYNAVSCSAPRFCVAVEENGHELFFGTQTPFLKQADAFGVPLTSVGCASPALCLAVDEEGNAVTYTANGAHRVWSVPRRIDPFRLTGVACTVRGFCLAVDDGGGTVVYANGAWAPPSRTVPLTDLRAVACTGAATCVAIQPDSAAIGVG